MEVTDAFEHGVPMKKTTGPDVASFVLQELNQTGAGGGWWNTPTAAMLIDLAKAGPFVVALAGIAEVLRSGEDPDWAVGGITAAAAFSVAQEWLDSGIEPADVAAWLRAGCWDPRAASQLVVLGVRSDRLIDESGKPRHWVKTASGEEMSVALAVADNWISAREAARAIGRS
jgi:hypothetical protein